MFGGSYFNAKLILPLLVTRHRAEGGCKEIAYIWLGTIPKIHRLYIGVDSGPPPRPSYESEVDEARWKGV